MAEPQGITGDNLPDIAIDHRLIATTTLETGNTIPSDTLPEIGDTIEDGTIYAGISPDTGEAMYITPADAPGTLRWKQAMKYADNLDTNGHKDWKLPTKSELKVLFKNLARISGFNKSGSFFSGRYWSSTEVHGYLSDAWIQYFHINSYGWEFKFTSASVRPVRLELRP